ncbi:MAG: hypothetical protein PHV16_01285 [Candidatus Nanoarchaeia archaeon]|nr:hypothetical protein [Candidatus Nanoarchaeia archaeon]
MLTFETIVKAIIALVVLIVIVVIAANLFPKATQDFFNATNIDSILGVGKERYESEFEISDDMKENINDIKEAISKLKEKDVAPGTTIKDLTSEEFELNDFGGSELTVEKNKEGKLKITVKNLKGQIKSYEEDITYEPCIINIDEKELEERILEANKKYEIDPNTNMIVDIEDKVVVDDSSLLIDSSDVYNVDKIIFINENKFKVDNKEYNFGNSLIKTKDNKACFLYE